MPAALDLLSRGGALIAEQFGTTPCTIEGLGAAESHWNDLGRTEELVLNGRRVTFSALVEIPRTAFPSASAAELLALPGKIVTRTDTGAAFRIVGEVQLDELTVRFPIETRQK